MRGTGHWLNGEEGHVLPALGGIIAGAGAIVLMIGAVADNDATAIVGGIVLAVGAVATPLLEHIGVDYGIYGRVERLERREREP